MSKIEFGSILETLGQRHTREKRNTSFTKGVLKKTAMIAALQLLSSKTKIQVTNMQDHLQRYCDVLLVIGCNSAKCDKLSITSDLIAILINEPDFGPVVTANYCILFKMWDIQLLDIMSYPRETTSLDYFMRHTNLEKQKLFLRKLV